MTNEFPTSFRTNFLSGAFALSSASAVMHPIDTMKTQIQSSSFTSFPNTIYSSMRFSLLRGLLTSMIVAAPQGGIRFSVYEYSKLQMREFNSKTQINSRDLSVETIVSAINGDIAASLVRVPREVILRRIQSCRDGDSGLQSTSSVVRNILSTDGLSGFYRGYFSAQLRDMPFIILLFTFHEHSKLKLKQNGLETSPWWSSFAGATSGALAAFLTTPADVVNAEILTRKRNQLKRKTEIVEKIKMKDVFKMIVTTNGWKGLMVGCAPRTIWWFGICGIFFPLYQASKVLLH